VIQRSKQALVDGCPLKKLGISQVPTKKTLKVN